MKATLRVAAVALMCCALTGSFAANVWFITQRAIAQSRTTLQELRLLKEGDSVAPLEARNSAGERVQVTYADVGMPTLLYVLSPRCQWCALNAQNIKAIAEQASNRFRVVGVSLEDDGLAEYLAREQYSFPVLSGISPDMRATYALGPTPETLLIGSDGHVIKVWLGTFGTPAARAEVERFLQVTLPTSEL